MTEHRYTDHTTDFGHRKITRFNLKSHVYYRCSYYTFQHKTVKNNPNTTPNQWTNKTNYIS